MGQSSVGGCEEPRAFMGWWETENSTSNFLVGPKSRQIDATCEMGFLRIASKATLMNVRYNTEFSIVFFFFSRRYNSFTYLIYFYIIEIIVPKRKQFYRIVM